MTDLPTPSESAPQDAADDVADSSATSTATATSPPENGSGPRRAPRASKAAGELGQIRQALTTDLARLGALATIAMPLTGMVITARAERAAEALTLLAEKDKRVLGVLRLIVGASMYAELGFIVGDVAAAMAVERGVLPMDHPLAASIQVEIGVALEMQHRQQAAAEAVARERGVDLEG